MYTIRPTLSYVQRVESIIKELIETDRRSTALQLQSAFLKFEEGIANQPQRWPRLDPGKLSDEFRVGKLLWFRIAYRIDDASTELYLLAIRHEKSSPSRLLDDVR